MKIYEDISLKDFCTFGIDVKARRLVVIENEEDVNTLPPSEREDEVRMLILGGGSNMVFTKDYDGTVITLGRNYQLPTINYQLSTISAWGGMVMDDLVQWTLDQGFYGLENLSAIPGTVGASAVQNVGAYGAEAKDFIERVEAYDLVEHRRCSFSNADCRFAYRQSMFKEQPGRYLILRVSFRLSRTFVPNLSYKALEGLPHATAQQFRDAIIDLRWGKLPKPEEHGSAGSFFKNPVVEESTYLRIKQEYPDMPEAHGVHTPQSTRCVACSPNLGEQLDSCGCGNSSSPKLGEGDPKGGGVCNGYKLSAGWLIDRAGWKGRTQGRAGVWPQNALVLYNAGGCSGGEVVALAQAIQQDVKDKFGVQLEPEAIII